MRMQISELVARVSRNFGPPVEIRNDEDRQREYLAEMLEAINDRISGLNDEQQAICCERAWRTIRDTHGFRTWPAIAEVVKAVSKARREVDVGDTARPVSKSDVPPPTNEEKRRMGAQFMASLSHARTLAAEPDRHNAGILRAVVELGEGLLAKAPVPYDPEDYWDPVSLQRWRDNGGRPWLRNDQRYGTFENGMSEAEWTEFNA